MDENLHASETSELNGGEWSPLSSGRFATSTPWFRGRTGLTAYLNFMVRRKIPDSIGNQIWTIRPVTFRFKITKITVTKCTTRKQITMLRVSTVVTFESVD
jgi:hypothetical protein